MVRSWYELAMTCSPTGKPSLKPHGNEMPGSPEMFTGSVKMSFRYIESGSFTFAPMGNATVGEVGVTCIDFLEHAVVLVFDERAHLLRLDVVRVVVPGRQRVRAEDHPDRKSTRL